MKPIHLAGETPGFPRVKAEGVMEQSVITREIV
jgi:hypothetical protein